MNSKSSQPDEVKIEVDKLMKPIEFILTYPNEMKKENEFKQAMHNFRNDYINECVKVESIIYAYRKIKYNKLQSEIGHKIHIFTSMVNSILLYLTKNPQSKIIPVFIQSLVLTLYDILVSLLFKILKVKYNISDSDKDFNKYFEKDLEKDLEKEFSSCVGFLCWFLTID